jgi:hypothetical protein
MRLSRLGEPIELDLGWPHGSLQDELRDPFEKTSGAPDRWPQRYDVAACGLRRLRTRGNEGGATAWLEHGERPLRDIATDRIENRITVGHHLCEIGNVVLDDLIGAETAHVGVVDRAGSGNEVGADMLGELNGKTGNPTGSALDQDRLPAL